MKKLIVLLMMMAACAAAAQQVLVLTTDGEWIEGATTAALPKVLSMHNGAPATARETETINAGLEAILGKDRKARDQAVEALTNIGLPVLTPLLAKIKDTDQHEPKPLYNLFGRLVPSTADQPDRTSALIRKEGAEPVRGPWPGGELTVGGKKIAWANVRMLAVKRKSITKTVDVHSLRHSTQIEYLDTGIYATPNSHWTIAARGFTRLSWHQDDWATGPNGLTKPAGNYKTNLVDGHPFGALVGRVGSTGAVQFLGGSSKKAAAAAGRLFLAINDNAHWQNNLGSYLVTVTITDAYDVGWPL